ncbi:MFS transporter [Piscinibacter sp. XHJ-5]|uniref:MFS transporter n=1 Tax=Piscinibacter sp. XHJ-5 TaxID=3037797 RepID=UPI0024531C1B|nr:MFS transporter [Piscinibacter sp. XHJ-5]
MPVVPVKAVHGVCADPRGSEQHSRRAWLMVAACAAMVAMGFGAIVNIAVFLMPLGMEFGWSRADLSLAYSIAGVATGVGGIVMGHFADRVPIRRVILCGGLVPGISFLLLSRLDSTFELYLYHAVLGLAGVGAIMAPLNSLAGLWLARNPGLAIGVVSAGGALGQGLMPFLARHLVLAYGWRPAYLLLGVLYLVVMAPLALWIRDAPRHGAAPAATASPSRPPGVSSSWLLAWLCVAVTFCCLCMATPIVHVAALGSDLGLDGQASAGLLAVMMVFGMAGRLGFGRLAERAGSLQAYIVASAGQTALAFMFPLMQSRPALYTLSALFGLVFSGAMTSFILCAREHSPGGRTGLSIGVVMSFGWLGMALGGWQGGLFYDLCGSYRPSFANASLGGVANLLVLGLLYQVTVRRPGMRAIGSACKA